MLSFRQNLYCGGSRGISTLEHSNASQSCRVLILFSYMIITITRCCLIVFPIKVNAAKSTEDVFWGSQRCICILYSSKQTVFGIVLLRILCISYHQCLVWPLYLSPSQTSLAEQNKRQTSKSTCLFVYVGFINVCLCICKYLYILDVCIMTQPHNIHRLAHEHFAFIWLCIQVSLTSASPIPLM